jgi:hypothetical protein
VTHRLFYIITLAAFAFSITAAVAYDMNGVSREYQAWAQSAEIEQTRRWLAYLKPGWLVIEDEVTTIIDVDGNEIVPAPMERAALMALLNYEVITRRGSRREKVWRQTGPLASDAR